MDSVRIRKYNPADYDDVCRMVHDGTSSHIKKGITIGRKNPNVIGYLICLFIFGSFSSIMHGCIALMIGLCIHSASVYLIYKWSAW